MSIRVLAVEDDPTAQRLYSVLCSRFHFDLTIVPSCDEAIATLRILKYDLIVMDWHLAGLDGLRCARAIREDEEKTGIYTPIVAVTACAMPGDRETCLQAGMNDYLSKPFSMDQFSEIVERWANRIIEFPQNQVG